MLRTLKAEQLERLLGAEVWDEALIQRALPTFEMILRYILSQTEIDKTSFAGKVAAIQSSKIKDIAMTLAQQFRQEGRQEGQEKGLWIGKIQTLEEFLALPVTAREVLGTWSLQELETACQRLHGDYENRFKRS